MVAAGSIIISSLIAMRQDHLKRRLAFSTVGQLSYIVLGAALLSPLSIKGAYLHLVAHAVMKITLFMCAGLIIARTHRNNISELYGIGKKLPVTMACFTIASLGIAGTPFLVGFVSKWNLALGALQAGKPLYILIWVASALLAAAYLDAGSSAWRTSGMIRRKNSVSTGIQLFHADPDLHHDSACRHPWRTAGCISAFL